MFKILLVDDNFHARQFLRFGVVRLFDECGLPVEIEEASEGRQAMELLSQNAFDLVLTDHYMPIMNGEQVIRRIRQHDQTTPILATSASGEDGKWQLLEAGADAFVAKPLRSKDLVATLKSLLKLG